jgi:hypothetical protein
MKRRTSVQRRALVESLEEMEEEFGISIPDRDRGRLEPTFDSLVRYLAERNEAGYIAEGFVQ